MLFSNKIVLNLPLESFAVVLNDNVPMRWHHGSDTAISRVRRGVRSKAQEDDVLCHEGPEDLPQTEIADGIDRS